MDGFLCWYISGTSFKQHLGHLNCDICPHRLLRLNLPPLNFSSALPVALAKHSRSCSLHSSVQHLTNFIEAVLRVCVCVGVCARAYPVPTCVYVYPKDVKLPFRALFSPTNLGNNQLLQVIEADLMES